MLSVLLAVGLFTEILCGPLPNHSTELIPNEGVTAVELSSDPPINIPSKTNPTMESDSSSADEEKLQAQETFYPVGVVWWGVRPWGGWGGYRPWAGPHWGGHWGGGRWGNHWGGHWGGGRWGRTSS